MNKFENVQVGDTVYTIENISYGWNSSEPFTIPEKVIKVTKTQFVTESGKRFKKDSGSEIGKSFYSRAYKEGDKFDYFFNGDVVSDQTKKLESFKNKLRFERNIARDLQELKIPLNSKFNIDELIEISEIVSNLKSKLGS